MTSSKTTILYNLLLLFVVITSDNFRSRRSLLFGVAFVLLPTADVGVAFDDFQGDESLSITSAVDSFWNM